MQLVSDAGDLASFWPSRRGRPPQMTAARAGGAMQAVCHGEGKVPPAPCTHTTRLESGSCRVFCTFERLKDSFRWRNTHCRFLPLKRNRLRFRYWLRKAWVELLTSVASLTKQALRPCNEDLDKGHPIKAPMVENQLLVAKINS